MRNAEPLTVSDLLNLKVVADAQVDPAGTQVAYVVGDNVCAFKEPNIPSSIWLADVTNSSYGRLTTGNATNDMPRWSADGSQLAFRSDRDERGKGQIYLLQDRFGEAVSPYHFPSGVVSYIWSTTGFTIFALVRDEPESRAEGKDEILFEEDLPCIQVWRLDLDSGEANRVTHGPVNVWEIAPSPDGRSLAAIVSDHPYNWSWYDARLVRIDIESGSVTTLYAPERQITRPCWLPDGSGIALISSTWSDPGMTGGDVILIPTDGGEARNLTEGHPRSYLSLHSWPDSGSLLASASERGEAGTFLISLDGQSSPIWIDVQAFSSSGMSANADGSVIAATLSSSNEPPELWVTRTDVARGEWDWEQVSRHNREVEGRALGRVDSLVWQAPDGLEIQGLFYRPELASNGSPPPMVTFIHGGPTGSWDHAFPAQRAIGWISLLLARGIAVFLPNPRGSAGRGVAFAEANIGDLGGADLDDILAGVDHCVAHGMADSDRLGICGRSYGGYLTPWALTCTSRFKAAISGASITNWFSFHGDTDIPGFDETFYRADPYALDGPYATRSPLFFVDRIQTPTLFFHGEQDPCCPVGQAYEMFRALRSRGIETQCVIYPREGHGIREREHRRDLLERGIDWFVERLGVERGTYSG